MAWGHHPKWSLEEGQEGARPTGGGGSRDGEMRSHTVHGHW